jgi:hypothetical protein
LGQKKTYKITKISTASNKSRQKCKKYEKIPKNFRKTANVFYFYISKTKSRASVGPHKNCGTDTQDSLKASYSVFK